MALTRKFLEAMGIDENKIESIIEAHVATVDGLKKERDDAKAQAGTADQLTAERDKLQKQVDELMKNGSDAIKVQAEFDAYKASVEADKVLTGKRDAVRSMLRNAGVNRDEFMEFLAGKIELDKVELDGGTVKGADELLKPLKDGYGGFFSEVKVNGTPPVNAPSSGGQGGMTKDAFEKLSLTEQCVFANEHPAEYAGFYQ